MLYGNGLGPRVAGAVTVGEVAGVVTATFESCHSVWLFDPERMRLRRVPKGTSVGVGSGEGEWQVYFGADVDGETGGFVIILNEDGTRLLRSWLHVEPSALPRR